MESKAQNKDIFQYESQEQATDLLNKNEFVGSRKDIWKGTNHLTNLKDTQIIPEINKYIRSLAVTGETNNKKYPDTFLIYHKIIKESSGNREPRDYEGYFSLVTDDENMTYICSFLYITGIIKRVNNNKYNISKIGIVEGYSIRKNKIRICQKL